MPMEEKKEEEKKAPVLSEEEKKRRELIEFLRKTQERGLKSPTVPSGSPSEIRKTEEALKAADELIKKFKEKEKEEEE